MIVNNDVYDVTRQALSGTPSAAAYAQQKLVNQYAEGSPTAGTPYAQQAKAAQGEARKTDYIDANGNVQQGTTMWDTLGSDIRTAFEAQQEANNQALELAQQRARETAAAQIEALNQGYQGTNRQLYRDYMQQQRALPQQLAARGYTGGLTESSRLRLGASYGEGLNENERARLGQEAGYNQALAQQLYEAQATANAANSEALQSYYSQMNQLNAQRMEQERADLEQRAAELAAVGNFDLYSQLGYTDEEIAYLRRMFRRQHPGLFRNKKKRGGSGGSVGGGGSGGSGGGGGSGGSGGGGSGGSTFVSRSGGGSGSNTYMTK